MDSVYHYGCLTSTNAVLEQLITSKNYAKSDEKLPNATIVYTDFQSNGRGRQSNKWFSESGKNLLMSILIYPDLTVGEQFQVSMWTALALSDYLRQNVGLHDVYIKWPNDIYVRNKKIAGILIEHTVKSNKLGHSIIGIGLNLNQEQFPSDLPYATSVYMETGRKVAVTESLTAIRSLLLSYMKASPETIRESYCKQLYLLNQKARFMVKATQELFEGYITDVDAYGRIRIQQEQNIRQTIDKEPEANIPQKSNTSQVQNIQQKTITNNIRCFELNEIRFLP